MDRLTLIVVPDERSRVRHFQVSRRWVRWAPGIAAALALLLLAALADYVRLRLEGVDVDRLRAETAQHRSALQDLAGDFAALEQELTRIREFERKVRVIANLPGAIVEAQLPDLSAQGQGGPAEARGDPTAPQEAPQGARGGRGGGQELPPVGARATADFDSSLLAGLQTRSGSLARSAGRQSESLGDLVERLRGRSRRLASTPSIWPTEGWVTSGYGPRTSPFTGRRQFHAGLDIAARFGTDVIAPARGRVVFVGRRGPLGKSLEIDHGYGLRSAYGHAAEVYVREGQEVERGTRIASVGNTGRSTGPHLHYSISVDGKSVNPANYVLE